MGVNLQDIGDQEFCLTKHITEELSSRQDTLENGNLQTCFSDLLKVTQPGDKIIFKLYVAICPSAMSSSVEFCKYQDCSLALVPELD